MAVQADSGQYLRKHVKTKHSLVVILAVMLASGSAMLLAQGQGTPAQSLAAPPCTITGSVSVGQAKLPGVAITVAPKDGGNPILASTGLDGMFRVHPAKPGEYDIVAELAAFASATKSVTLGADCKATVELTTTLRSRVPAAVPSAAATATGTAPAAPAQPVVTMQQPQRGQAGGQQFQRVAPQRGQASGQAADAGVAGADDAATVAQHLSLPAGFTADSVAESVTTFGSNTQVNDAFLFGGGRGEGRGPGGDGGFGGQPGVDGQMAGLPGMPGMGGGFAQGAFGMPQGGGGGGRGGDGGGGGRGGGGEGGFGGGPGGRGGLGNLRGNRYSGQASYTLSGSTLNANPYPLNGQSTNNPDFSNSRYTAAFGGPAKIPGLFDLGTRSSFFLNYSGNYGGNLYDSYSVVPTQAMRNGDFSAFSKIVYDPLTGQPFPGNVIPSNRISPIATSLLQYYPLPNQDGTTQNYHFASTTHSTGNDLSFRFTRTFGTPPANSRGGRGGGAGGGGGRGGRGGMMNNVINLNASVSYSHSSGTQLSPFPSITGTTQRTGWNVPINLSFGKWGLMNQFSLTFNRNKSQTDNQFGGVNNVAGNAGIQGVSTDPFDYGVPTLSFATFSGLHNINQAESLSRNISFSGSQQKMKGRHTMRWGGDFRSLLQDTHTSNANARGSFIFTGYYTADGVGNQTSSDFADFLLGGGQQGTIQYGPGLESFHARAYSAYFQDDWRVGSKVTLNLGARYEYQSPYAESSGHLVTLDAPPDFSAATAVLAGQTGPYFGQFPKSIITPDRNNVAPRLGFAWRAAQTTTVRGGYGINYASVPYMTVAQKLATQPPFAYTNTVLGTYTAPVLMSNAFAVAPSPDVTTNTFAVDPNYRIGYVQIWNAGVQHDVKRIWTLGATYTGTKGTSLDLLRAPNRGPNGLRIPDVQAFLWESSNASSIMNALSLSLRKRQSHGFQGGVTYTLSKSMDDASAVGGSGNVVAQNDLNLAAEWGRSSFDQRHRITGDFAIELPFGPNRKWVTSEGVLEKIVGNWIVNGNISYSSGSPFTARINAASSDVARGTSGTLRADYNGQPINVSDPSTAQFFNTSAFSVPVAGTFGNSDRNLITGPSNRAFNMSMSKSFRFATTRSVSLRIQANNVLNLPVWGSIDTTVNSPTFGRVTSMRAMRSVQIIARVNF